MDSSFVPSNINADETVVFFNVTASYDSDKQQWTIPIHGWVYEPEDSLVRKKLFRTGLEQYGLDINEDNQVYFNERVNLLISDNERGKVLTIHIAGETVTLAKTKKNGHVTHGITLDAERVESHRQDDSLEFFATDKAKGRIFKGLVRLIPEQGVSVISDIDDTIKLTNVVDKKKLLENTFLKEFVAVSGMAEKYSDWAKQGVAIHFVSSSPWYLYQPLVDFTESAGFPWASFSLKAFRFRDRTVANLFKKGTETKPEQIRSTLFAYPQRQFILIGDSGEQDPEVYTKLLSEFPNQISQIYIRNVTDGRLDDNRFAPLLEAIPKGRFILFTNPTSLNIPNL